MNAWSSDYEPTTADHLIRQDWSRKDKDVAEALTDWWQGEFDAYHRTRDHTVAPKDLAIAQAHIAPRPVRARIIPNPRPIGPADYAKLWALLLTGAALLGFAAIGCIATGWKVAEWLLR